MNYLQILFLLYLMIIIQNTFSLVEYIDYISVER